MDREKIKLIVRNLESLVECLKAEINTNDKDPQYEEIKNFLNDYDEVFYDDEDEIYEPVKVNKKYKLTNDDDGDDL